MNRTLAVILAALLVVAGGGLYAWHRAEHRGLHEIAVHAMPEAPAADGARRLTAAWLGTAAVLLEDGETSLLIDPFFSRPALWRVATDRPLRPDDSAILRGLAALDLMDVSAVLVSHSHYDHAMDAGRVARMTHARLFGSASTANIGRGAGMAQDRIQTITAGEAYQIGRFRVRFFDSRHAGAGGGRPTGEIEQPLVPPAGALEYRQGGTFSILIEHPLGNVLHHGSAGYEPEALAGLAADVVFLGVALIERDDFPHYLAETVDRVGATRVIPLHWDQFGRLLDQPMRAMPVAVDLPAFFADMAALRPAVRVLTMQPPKRYVLYAAAEPTADAATEPAH